jgi:hypothetical protein
VIAKATIHRFSSAPASATRASASESAGSPGVHDGDVGSLRRRSRWRLVRQERTRRKWRCIDEHIRDRARFVSASFSGELGGGCPRGAEVKAQDVKAASGSFVAVERRADQAGAPAWHPYRPTSRTSDWPLRGSSSTLKRGLGHCSEDQSKKLTSSASEKVW